MLIVISIFKEICLQILSASSFSKGVQSLAGSWPSCSLPAVVAFVFFFFKLKLILK